MRSRSFESSSGWGLRIAIAVAVLVVVAVVGLAIYGGRVQPHQQPVEQVVPNDRLPQG